MQVFSYFLFFVVGGCGFASWGTRKKNYEQSRCEKWEENEDACALAACGLFPRSTGSPFLRNANPEGFWETRFWKRFPGRFGVLVPDGRRLDVPVYRDRLTGVRRPSTEHLLLSWFALLWRILLADLHFFTLFNHDARWTVEECAGDHCDRPGGAVRRRSGHQTLG